MYFLGVSDDKASACNAGDLGLIPGLRRSPGEENGNPTPVLLSGWRRLVDHSPCGCKESDTTEGLHFHFALSLIHIYLHDPDDHDGVITPLEPDILECEVKWAVGSIATNKASVEVMEFQLNYFKS